MSFLESFLYLLLILKWSLRRVEIFFILRFFKALWCLFLVLFKDCFIFLHSKSNHFPDFLKLVLMLRFWKVFTHFGFSFWISTKLLCNTSTVVSTGTESSSYFFQLFLKCYSFLHCSKSCLFFTWLLHHWQTWIYDCPLWNLNEEPQNP